MPVNRSRKQIAQQPPAKPEKPPAPKPFKPKTDLGGGKGSIRPFKEGEQDYDPNPPRRFSR